MLAISDEVLDEGYRSMFSSLEPDVVVACGDLPDDYLEDVMDGLSVPLVWVPGNHDGGPSCGVPADGRIVRVAGLTIAGLGGSPQYNRGPYQYTEKQMKWRALKLEMKARWSAMRGRPVDVLITHSPPRGLGDGDDKAHRGFDSFRRLIAAIRPRFFVHGHIHPCGLRPADIKSGTTTIINAVGYRLLEVDAR